MNRIYVSSEGGTTGTCAHSMYKDVWGKRETRTRRGMKLPYPLALFVLYIIKLSKQARMSQVARKYGFVGVNLQVDVVIHGNVQIGEHSYIGKDCILTSGPASKVVLGRYCSLGHAVFISSLTHTTENKRRPKEGDVIIGDFVWLGSNVVITPGHRIGNGVVVGANSVVTHNIPDNWVVGGVPARFIKMRS